MIAGMKTFWVVGARRKGVSDCRDNVVEQTVPDTWRGSEQVLPPTVDTTRWSLPAERRDHLPSTSATSRMSGLRYRCAMSCRTLCQYVHLVRLLIRTGTRNQWRLRAHCWCGRGAVWVRFYTENGLFAFLSPLWELRGNVRRSS